MAAWVDPRSTAQLKAAASTDQSARAALRDQGYSVGQDSSSGPVYVEQGGSSGGGGGGGGGAAAGGQNQADILAAFKESSGFSREQLAETKRQFDATMAQKTLEWTQSGLPELQIKQQLASLEDQKFHETVRQFDANNALAQSGMGLDYLKTASSLSGPADYFQSVDFNRGATARGDVPTFLSALSNNTALPSFTAAGTQTQDPQSMANLAGKLQGTGATSPGGYNTDQALNQIGSLFKAGPTGLAAGSLEKLDPNELALLKSGAGKLGYDYDSWVRNYSKSGVGQSAGQV